MKSFRQWPLLVTAAAYLAAVATFVELSLRENNGHLVYALDDTYIHMALAKNFVQHGVWGVTPYGFSSSTSSILWPLLLSLAYAVCGVNQSSPLVLNILFAILDLVVVSKVLEAYKAASLFRFFALVAFTFFAILPALTLQGMEHMMHIGATLLVTYLAARFLSDDAQGHTRRDFLRLLCAAPLVTAARFEGMFLILVIGALFVLHRRWQHALAFGASGFTPVAIYGFISALKGWHWLPNSVLLKGTMPDLKSPWAVITHSLYTLTYNLDRAPHLSAILLAVLLLYISAYARKGARESRQLMTAILIGTTLLHLEFAIVCFLCRYDAYLIALGLLIVLSQLVELIPPEWGALAFSRRLLPKHAAITALAAVLFFPLAMRAVLTPMSYVEGMSEIYHQQYQMGLFMKRYYEGSAVALNDIGAVDYLADIHLVDLVGLANMEVSRERLRKNYHTAEIRELSRESGARIAIVYDAWFGDSTSIGGLPPEWTKVGEWSIPYNIVASEKTVSIYALKPTEAPLLIQHLRDFSTSLPQGVIQAGRYNEWVPGSP